jgi:putative transposase
LDLMKRAKSVQWEFEFLEWGGKRQGAGRKRKAEKSSVSHVKRPALAARHPVHVTLRGAKGLPSLRRRAAYRGLVEAFRGGRERFGFRLVHCAVMSNHVHLVVEAEGQSALSRGMQGLAVRMARAVNRVWARTGAVFAERFHAHVLRTPREVRKAVAYVLENARKHGLVVAPGMPDPFTSGSVESGLAVARARTWLLSVGWRRCAPA